MDKVVEERLFSLGFSILPPIVKYMTFRTR
jgi:hypothetical protein